MQKNNSKFKINLNRRTLPHFFKPLFWYCDFSKIDLQKGKEDIMIQTINYGNWKHWQWLFRYYGIEKSKEIIKNIPMTALREGALKLILLIFNINKLKYASRSDRIKTRENISET